MPIETRKVGVECGICGAHGVLEILFVREYMETDVHSLCAIEAHRLLQNNPHSGVDGDESVVNILFAEFRKYDADYVLVLVPPRDISFSYRPGQTCNDAWNKVAVELKRTLAYVREHEGERSPRTFGALPFVA